jgi:CTP:phosphocholine cytidylyltransferase-like protein
MIDKKMFDVLARIAANEPCNDEVYIKGLINAGLCLCDGVTVTEKGYAILERHKVDNAIILAAGLSSRFVPISFDVPKGLLRIRGEVLIERQIRQLKEKGINEIIIVVGHAKEQFYYLRDKYNTILIETVDFLIKNNYASVYSARQYLKNTIVTSSDLYFSKNLFQLYAYDSYYCSVFANGNTEERGLVIDDNDKIIDTYYGCHDIWVSLGYAFFSKRFSETYINITSKIINNPEIYNKFWADIQDDYLSELYMYIKRCGIEDIHEFDTLKEVYEFQPDFKGRDCSESLQYICSIFQCDETKLHDFLPLAVKGSIKICSFRFLNELYYFLLFPDQFLDVSELTKLNSGIKFKFVDFDIKRNRIVIKINEGTNE